MQKLRELLLRFKRDEGGAFIVIFGILGLVLIATAGAVVDFTTIEQARTRAQDALDSAALGLQKTIYTAGVTEATLSVDALAVLTERLNDENISATITNVDVVTATGTLRIQARLTIPTAFVALVGVSQVSASITSEVARGSVDLEVAVALDTTGSMGTPNPQKIIDLRAAANALIDTIMLDDNTGPTSVRMGFVPYSQAVNVGTYADNVRGAMTGSTTVNGASWSTGTAKSITASSYLTGTQLGINSISKASNALVTTASNHGYVDGDRVYIIGVSGMTQVNGKAYTITKVSNTTFQLNVRSSSWSNYSSSSSDFAQKCTYSTCEITVTAAAHGFVNGDTVWVKTSGTLAGINNTAFVVANRDTNTFSLTGSNGVGTAYQSGGTAQACQVALCEIVVQTSTAHGLTSDSTVRITGVRGTTQINNSAYSSPRDDYSPALAWDVGAIVSTTKFVLPLVGPNLSTYTNTGTAQCADPGCALQVFENQNGDAAIFYPTTCVTERVGGQAYTEAAPSSALMGSNYRASGSNCIAQTIVPLTDEAETLRTTANGLTASGSTGGHIGIAWAWYLLSPQFAYLWPAANQPAAYATGPDDVIKVVIIMTDGAYNTTYRNGIIAKDSISGSGGNTDRINLNSSNGSSLVQGAAYCAAMKQDADLTDTYNRARVVVYTVGFDIASDANAQTLLNGCASDPTKAYLASNGAQLLAAFQDIANNIAQLRVTK